MINAIVAIDENRGMADDHGIPWDLPTDAKFFVDKLQTGIILMGYGTYLDLKEPFHGRTNYVATHKDVSLKPGFEVVHDVDAFLNAATDDVWNIGGAGLLTQTLDRIDTFYVTQIFADFKTTKILPEFGNKFKLINTSEKVTENGTTFAFQTWIRAT